MLIVSNSFSLIPFRTSHHKLIPAPESEVMPLKLDNEADLREAQAALFNVNSQTGWLLLNYVAPSTVHFTAGGEGGPDDIAQQLEDDQIQYGLMRLGDVQERGTLKTTIRDVFFTWIGPSVGIIEKGKKTAFLGDAQSYLQPFHADVTVLNKSNFNREKYASSKLALLTASTNSSAAFLTARTRSVVVTL